MNRAPVLLGDTGHLFGIRTLPVGRRTSRNGVIILNAGLLHHVGPYRLHIDFADRLAAKGHAVICMDQSGKGESPRRKGVSRQQSLLLDHDAAMNELAQYGVNSVVLVGLCSGADDATLIAQHRDNVSGIVLLDGYARRTARFHVTRLFNRYVRNLFSLSAWAALLSGKAGESRWDGIDIRNWGNDEEMIAQYTNFLDRNGRILALFTSGQDYYNYAGQLASNLADCKGFQNLTEIYNKDANHTYSLTRHRDRLMDQIQDWLTTELPASADTS